MAWPLPFNTYWVTDSLQVRSENLSKYSCTFFRARAMASDEGVASGAISPGGAWAAQGPPMKANAATSATRHHAFSPIDVRGLSARSLTILLICAALRQTGIRM